MDEFPRSDLASPNFRQQFHENSSNTGFNALTGYESIRSSNGRGINELKALLYRDLNLFSQLSDEEKMKYHRPEMQGQRGYTPNGVEQSGEFPEIREHLMYARPLPKGHPLECMRPLCYEPNVDVDCLPELKQNLEEMFECLNTLTLHAFEEVALAVGLPQGRISGPLVRGQQFLRLHVYPAVDQVLEHRIVDNVEIAGETLNGISVVDAMYKGKEYKNAMRASPHQDVGFYTWLLGSEVGGLNILTKEGEAMPFRTEPNTIIGNPADFFEHAPQSYRSVIHWVGMNKDTAMKQRMSIANFGHTRPTSLIGDVLALKRLYDRLNEIGYMDIPTRDALNAQAALLPADEEIISKSLQWEKRNHVEEFGRYYYETKSGIKFRTDEVEPLIKPA